MTITKITIVQTRHGADHVMLSTDLPGATWGEGTLTLEFRAAAGTGPAYVALHFPDVPVEVIKEGAK